MHYSATIMVTSFSITNAIMFKAQEHFEKNPSISYAKHNFISVPLDRLSMQSCALMPSKWFFSEYYFYSKEQVNITQRAFRKLSIVSDVPSKETEQFRVFEEALKRASVEKPWFSNSYKGCLRYNGKCYFYKSTSKVCIVC